jgi:nucleolar protein 15
MVKQVKEIKDKKGGLKSRQLSRRFHKLKVKKSEDNTGIIYIGHLPKGFNEKELKGFFSQFGEVSKLRVSRSKKTARSKGYAFLEFKGEHKGEGQKIA